MNQLHFENVSAAIIFIYFDFASYISQRWKSPIDSWLSWVLLPAVFKILSSLLLQQKESNNNLLLFSTSGALSGR
jgi:phosphate starvation-inducible membrane PsiE